MLIFLFQVFNRGVQYKYKYSICSLFSAGSRNCIGQKFAMYEEKSALSAIIRNFKLTAVEKREDLFLMRELILKSLNGIKVKLERRV